ncbi:MAG TPA: hypothetical protein VF581_05740 [Flavobacterium sp.]|jgi:hypothetical protein
MEALIKMVVDKTGISHEQAATAVTTVVGFLKDKLPAGIGSHLDSYVNSRPDANKKSGIDDLKDSLGGIFGK